MTQQIIRICRKHGETEFYWHKKARAQWECKRCSLDRDMRRRHASGLNKPMSMATDSPVYLGVYVAERALSQFFDHIERMPYGNPGYDFICGKGQKIDVKSACIRLTHAKYPIWEFHIRNNKIADYFLCLGFDDRDSLTPQCVWLIPGGLVNEKTSISISNSEYGLTKWKKYSRSIDKVIECVAEIQNTRDVSGMAGG